MFASVHCICLAGPKVYGCSLPGQDDVGADLQSVDESTGGEFLYAPKDVKSWEFEAKDNVHGLGYSGMQEQAVLSTQQTSKALYGMSGQVQGCGLDTMLIVRGRERGYGYQGRGVVGAVWLPRERGDGRCMVTKGEGCWEVYGYQGRGVLGGVWLPRERGGGSYMVTKGEGCWEVYGYQGRGVLGAVWLPRERGGGSCMVTKGEG